MIRRLITGLMCFFLLQGYALAAKAAPQDSFSTALRHSELGANPVQAYFLVGMLRDTGAPRDDVDALRRELLHAYAEQLAGGAAAAAPYDKVEDAIARGKSRPEVTDAEFVAAWQAAFSKWLSVRWTTTGDPAPYFTIAYRYMRPMAPGLWAAESSSGQTYFMLALNLGNKGKLPLPIHRPELVWGGEAGTGRGGLSFTCNWDGVPPPEGNVKADEVFMLEPGAETRPIFCETAPVGAYWKERLPALLAAAQNGGEQPQILSHEFDNRKRLSHLEIAMGNVGVQSGDWRRRYQVSKQEVGRRWKPALQPLDAPIAQKWTWSPNEGWAVAGEKLKWFVGATLVSLALFGVGRSLQRSGVPGVLVGVGTLVGLCGLFAMGMSHMGVSGGTGYDSPVFTGIALYAVVIGPMGLGIFALYGLHRLLDAEGLSWWQTVARGWQRATEVHSATSRAEFWGFFAQLVWWWGLANVCLKPLHLWIGGILLYPLLTLVVRRFRSMTSSELLSVLVTVVCLVLLALA